MYLHNFKKWVGRRGCMKGKLYQNFTVAEWLAYWMYLPEITGVIGKQKTKYLAFDAIWSITWSWKANFLVFSQGSVCTHIVWIIFGPLSIPSGSTDRLSTDPNLFRHLCAPGSTYTKCNTFTGAGLLPGNSLEKVEGCVQCLLRWHSCSTEPLVSEDLLTLHEEPVQIFPQTEQINQACGPDGVRGFPYLQQYFCMYFSLTAVQRDALN